MVKWPLGTGAGGGGMKRQKEEDFYGSENGLCDTAVEDTRHHTFARTHGTYNAKSGL